MRPEERTRRAMGGAVETDDVRESMTVLPMAFALPLTLLTGKPHTGQHPPRFTPTGHLAGAATSILCGLLVSGFALGRGGWWLPLLAPGWAMTLHGSRNLRMMIYHQCAHRNMWGRRRPDALLGKALAGLLVIQNFGEYAKEHVGEHHALHHMTMRDPTVRAILIGLALRPGMSRGRMWRRVLGKLASPRFHAAFLSARVRSYFYLATRAEAVGTLSAYATVAAVATWLHAWVFVLVAWVLPMTVFYQVSNTLRLCVKHTFPSPEQTDRRGLHYFAGLTNAIFLGERAPDPTLPPARRMAAWARWWTRMALVHFPSRYLVLTGDTVVHDYHHRHPMSRKWAGYVFQREAEATAGRPGQPPYRHVWGLVPAIDAVFDSLRAADSAEYDPALLADIDRRELFTAFDD